MEPQKTAGLSEPLFPPLYSQEKSNSFVEFPSGGRYAAEAQRVGAVFRWAALLSTSSSLAPAVKTDPGVF